MASIKDRLDTILHLPLGDTPLDKDELEVLHLYRFARGLGHSELFFVFADGREVKSNLLIKFKKP